MESVSANSYVSSLLTTALSYPIIRLYTQLSSDNILSESVSTFKQINSSIKSVPGSYFSGIKPFLGYYSGIIITEALLGGGGGILAAAGLYPLRLISTFNALNIGEYNTLKSFSNYGDARYWRGLPLFLFSMSTIISPVFFLVVGLPAENIRYTYVVGKELGKINSLSESYGFLKNKGIGSFYKGLPIWTIFMLLVTAIRQSDESSHLPEDRKEAASH